MKKIKFLVGTNINPVPESFISGVLLLCKLYNYDPKKLCYQVDPRVDNEGKHQISTSYFIEVEE